MYFFLFMFFDETVYYESHKIYFNLLLCVQHFVQLTINVNKIFKKNLNSYFPAYLHIQIL